MAFNNRGFLVAVLLAAAAAELVGNAAAATYVVGDTVGWRVPSPPFDYSNWASQHVFTVGDVLVFNYTANVHDVALVTKAAFDGCTSTTPILLVMTAPWNTTLNSTGEYYYICTFNGHCGAGQKLAINVTTSSPSPSPSPTPAPAPPTLAPTPSESPSPSPGSPAPSPGIGSTPSPAPGAGVTPPPPSPGAPGLAPPSENLSPPPPLPPSSATTFTIGAPVVGFALVAFGLMI